MNSKTLVINKVNDKEFYVEITDKEYDNNDKLVSENVTVHTMFKDDIMNELETMPVGNVADVCKKTYEFFEECDGCTI